MRKVALSIIGLLLYLSLAAQSDTLQLVEVVVLDSVRRSSPDIGHRKAIQDYILVDARVNLRSNGPNGLSSISSRGGNASQTSLRWNGIDLMSPSIGAADATLIYPFLFEDVQFGGHSTDKANTGLSGDLNFVNRISDLSGFNYELFAQSLSFDNQLYHSRFNYANQKYSTRLSLYLHEGDNNYPIPLLDGSSTEQTHAHLQRLGAMWNQQFRITDRDHIQLNLWLQDSQQQLPPTITQNFSHAEQFDDFIRVHAQHKSERNNVSYHSQIYYSSENNIYKDPFIGEDGHNHFNHYRAESKVEFEQDKWKGHLGLAYVLMEASTDNYQGLVRRENTEVNLMLGRHFNRQELSVLSDVIYSNEEWYNSYLAKLKSSWSKNLSTYLSIHKNFRFPGFNDQFWLPGGNPDLVVEESLTYEGGLKGNFKLSSFRFQPEFSVYSRNSDNWILWVLDPELNYWRAHNVNKVANRGIEYKLPFYFQWKELHYQLQISGQFQQAEFQHSVHLPNIEAGDAVYYVPNSSLSVLNDFRYRKYHLSSLLHYRSSSEGVVYTIDDFVVADVNVARQLKCLGHEMEFAVAVNNIGNSRYEFNERRPLPGRYYSFSLILKSL